MDNPTTLDLMTLVIAVIGAVTGIAAIMWNVAVFLLSGSRIKVETAAAWGHRSGSGGAIVGKDVWQGAPMDDRFTEPLVCITVRNTGRAPATITTVAMVAQNGLRYRETQPLGQGAKLPHRLDAGESAAWYYSREYAFALNASKPHDKRPEVRGEVDLATGKTKTSKDRVVL